MNKTVLKWELIGIIVISILGSTLHFFFGWSGQWEPMGAIAPVNESVWEHFKLAYWPTLVYAIVEYRFLKSYTSNYFFAKAVCIFIMPVIIATVFYSYTSVVDRILWVDIISFCVAIAIGQSVSYKLLTSRKVPRYLDITALILVIIFGITFILFTYYTPHLPVFRDPVTEGYGII
jgi:hypothetical protein